MNRACSILISGATLTVSAAGATVAQTNVAATHATPPSPVPTSPPPASPAPAPIASLVKVDLNNCASSAPIVPASSVRNFSVDRVARTLHGIWRGRVSGDYPPELIAADGYVNVDYYWIIDTEHGEALILEQLSPVRAAHAAPAGAPALSFLTCGRDGYVPRHPKQVHEFQKISSNLEDARAMLKTSTGLVVDDAELSLSAVWQQLVDTRYFDTARFGAYAGGLFKPFDLTSGTTVVGTPMVSLAYQAEYRGSGQTAAKFETGVPILGRESAGFIGVSTGTADYLVSTVGNGVEWLKEDVVTALINMIMDKVVLGPLVM